jgi:hypothetical protein
MNDFHADSDDRDSCASNLENPAETEEDYTSIIKRLRFDKVSKSDPLIEKCLLSSFNSFYEKSLYSRLWRNGETGLVVPPHREQELADAITRMLADDALRTAVVKNTKEEVKKCATKTETLRLYKESWEKACNANAKLKDQK